MNDILKSVLENMVEQQAAQQRRQAPQPQQPQQIDIGDLIGGILGGGAQAPRQQTPRQQTPQGGIGIEDMIGSIIGGTQRHDTGGASGIADLIGAIAGGRSQQVNPIAQIISQKFGIPPALAQMAVAYFTSKMMSKYAEGRSQQQQPDQFDIGRADRDPVDLDDLFEVMDDDQELERRFDESGMAEEFAEKSGVGREAAGGILKEILKAVGSKRQQVEPVRSNENDLEDLLDNW